MAGRYTAAAAYAFFMVYARLALLYPYGLLSAVSRAAAAADALRLVHAGLAVAVHLHLASARAGAHAEILYRAAEAGKLVALEVRQGNYYIRVCYRAPDLRLFDIFAAGDRNLRLVRAFQTVGYNYVAAGAERIVAVLIGRFEMF